MSSMQLNKINFIRLYFSVLEFQINCGWDTGYVIKYS